MKKIILLILIMFSYSIVHAESKYSLIYADNSEVEYETKEEAESKKDEYKLLGTYKTDSKGLVTLSGWKATGEIKIVEKSVPKGYKVISDPVYFNLEDKNVILEHGKEEVIIKVPDTNRKTAIIITVLSILVISNLIQLIKMKDKR